ncbi:Cytochrome P450 protein [Rutstroemia sp. NJR-2017a BBW]|nr:Cytochrome P450 protein [Rutstroemia sp. NJR-2017a BBW]
MSAQVFNSSVAQPELSQTWPSTTPQSRNTLLDTVADWHAWQYVVTFLLGVIIYDQVMYIKRKGSIAGPAFKIPLMGPFLQALHPKFDSYLAQWASGPLSCVSVFHKFVVLASDRDIAHKVFKSPSFAEPCIVPVAKDILGHTAWVFLQGRAHAEYRRGLTPLFTNKAIATYLPVQEKVLSGYFDKFVAASQANGGLPMAFMPLFREINCAISCRTFFGDYISQDAVKKIADDFYLATAALELVNVPLSLYIPFTKPWLGKRTADAVHVEFAKCAAACKANMATGATPTCVVDHWVLHMMESEKYRTRIAAGETDVEKPTNLIREFTNEEIGETLFTFLFASQDASSSATTWLFQILAQRPDVLARLREENLAARGGDRNKPFDLPMLESLTYTNAVIKELLRHRPPVIFVPYLATKNFPVTPNYTVPKGSMIIPSCYPALHDPEVYPNPDFFDPERWISGDAESKTKNWLVFGAGPHDCLARRYVPLSMAGMVGKAALELDWTHHATPTSEEIRVFATLFPMFSQNALETITDLASIS